MQQIFSEYTKKFKKDLVGLYKDYLIYCLSEQHLTSREFEDLAHLKLLFAITDTEANALHEELTGAIYKQNLADAIADRRLTDKERDFLANLKSKIGLPIEIADNIFAKTSYHYRGHQFPNKSHNSRCIRSQLRDVKSL